MTPDQMRALGATVRMQAWPISDAVKAALDEAALRIELNESALRAAINKWRETADTWEQQNTGFYVPSGLRRNMESPPEYGRASIRNWINWLRNKATEVEQILDGVVK